jgi:hypothetical protein
MKVGQISSIDHVVNSSVLLFLLLSGIRMNDEASSLVGVDLGVEVVTELVLPFLSIELDIAALIIE